MARDASKKSNSTKGDDGRAQMKMSQLASASGLTVSTIKFYMSQGLLPRPRKSKPNVAFYDQAFLKRLIVIKRMRKEGLSVKSVKTILDKYPFEKVTEWEDFKNRARSKDARELEEEERLATLSGEQRRREAILDAAHHVFSIRGYQSATVDDIAQQAGVSKGTCYQYFSGKEEIFIASMNRALDRILAEADEAAAGEKLPLAKLGFEGLTLISKFNELQFMFMGLYTEILGGNERMRKTAREMFDRVAGVLAREVEESVKKGFFREVDPMKVAYAMLGISWAAGSLDLMDKDFDVLGYFMDLVDFVQHGLLVDRKHA
jgi:AcrR family transcriptional regulator/predicted DNA-binding transcriptional regulator AlpA